MTSAGAEGLLDELNVSPSGRAILRRSALEFEHSGAWASFDTLAHEAAARDDTSFDLNEVFRLPSILGGAWGEERVSLTGLGVLLAGSGPEQRT